MGPTTLFDKSFLQSLNVDESMWFDNFFTALVAPIFYVETLSDLAKGPSKRASAETEVRYIASKFPEMHGTPGINHLDLCIGDLMGNKVPMEGAIPINGRNVKAGNQIGVVLDLPPEVDAFNRWAREEFLDIERLYAGDWRNKLNTLDLKKIVNSLNVIGINKIIKSLEEAKHLADEVVNKKDGMSERLNLINHFFNISPRLQREIFKRWSDSGCPALAIFAPYAAFVLSIEIFFHLALAANLISDRNSNRTDIAYLFYLPFCKIFVSSDKLHKKCAPLFLKEGQQYIWGTDLKKDLIKLNEYYKQLPDDIKKQGVMKFASEPPIGDQYLTSQVWDKYRLRHGGSMELTEQQEKSIVEQVMKLAEGDEISRQERNITRPLDHITIKRAVKERKGNWWQFQKDYPSY
jgi:hypothetical protein